MISARPQEKLNSCLNEDFKDLGLKIYATKGTSKFLAASNVEHECVPGREKVQMMYCKQ